MELLVSHCASPQPIKYYLKTKNLIAVGGVDYVSSTGQLEFAIGDTRECHRVQILNDDICELPEQELFFSSLTLLSGTPVITVDPNRAQIIIDDTDDCPSKLPTLC